MNDNRIMVGNGNTVGAVTVSSDATLHPNFENKKRRVSWPDWEERVSVLCDTLKKTDWLFVYGIPRGGVTLSTMLSHRLGIPMVADAPGYWMLDWYHWRMRQNIELKSTCRNILVVDAICDTGKTINYIMKDIDNNVKLTKDDNTNGYEIKIAAVDVDPKAEDKVDYYVNLKNPKHWLVYPWEVGSQELKGGL